MGLSRDNQLSHLLNDIIAFVYIICHVQNGYCVGALYSVGFYNIGHRRHMLAMMLNNERIPSQPRNNSPKLPVHR